MTFVPPRQATAPLAGTLVVLGAVLLTTLGFCGTPAPRDVEAAPDPAAVTSVVAARGASGEASGGTSGGQSRTSASSGVTTASTSAPPAGTRTDVPG